MDRATRHQAPGNRRGRTLFVLVWGFALLGGCATTAPHLDQALLTNAVPPNSGGSEQYQALCPDVLELQTVHHPELTGMRTIGADGRIDLAPVGRVRVEGMTVHEITRCVAVEAGVAPEAVTVRVAEHRSQFVYLFGEVNGQQRPVPYIGPETVLELLQRSGGITPGAAIDDIHLIRPHVADGGNPEVFQIDLEAIVRRHDQSSNVHVQPFDQVYVGQSQKCSYEKVVPPCLRPLYETIFGLNRDHH
jgi:protein involved in polysaccharide export with SLBB domain